MKKLLLVIILAVTFAFPAWAEYFEIEDYQVTIHLSEESAMHVTERIQVRFTQPRHGIFRDIPVEYLKVPVEGEKAKRFNTLNNKYKISLYDIETPGFKNKVSRHGDDIRIRIGDADKFVSGVQNYTIKYRVYGAINFFENHSEVYWNIIGTKWPVPIHKASFSILFPKNFALAKEDVVFYTGFFGDRNRDASISFNQRILSGYTKKILYPGQGFTIGVRMPEGYLNEGGFFMKLKLIFVNFKPFFLAAFILIVMYIVWNMFGKDEKVIDMVHFHPPKDMTPAEAGVLIDDSTDAKDLITLLFHWGAQGCLQIEEVEEQGLLLKSTDYIFTKLAELPDNAKQYERTMFNGLFAGSIKSKRLSDLKNTFYTTLREAKSELNTEVAFKDYYVPYTRMLQKLYYFLAAATMFSGIPLAAVNQDLQYVIAAAIVAAGFVLFGRVMPKKAIEGLHDYRAIKGFKEFIKMAEKDKLKMLVAEDPMYFDKTLPYAMALGEISHWGEKFEGLINEPPRWYVGPHGHHYHHNRFSSSRFTNNISKGMTSMASTMGSSPSSGGSGGSGFSGGGSGGGFGGGGGGSW